LVYFMTVWWCCGHLVCFSSFWYIVSTKIWHPWLEVCDVCPKWLKRLLSEFQSSFRCCDEPSRQYNNDALT
jgi:hypothetical protein